MGAYLITYILVLFTGGGSFKGFLILFFGGLLAIPILGIILYLMCYPIILISHAISERLLIKTIVANNVSDLGDIHRAAVMPEVEERVSEKDEKQVLSQASTQGDKTAEDTTH